MSCISFLPCHSVCAHTPCMHTHTHPSMHIHMHKHAYTHMCTRTHTMHMHIHHAHAHTCMYTHMYVHTYTHAHTPNAPLHQNSLDILNFHDFDFTILFPPLGILSPLPPSTDKILTCKTQVLDDPVPCRVVFGRSRSVLHVFVFIFYMLVLYLLRILDSRTRALYMYTHIYTFLLSAYYNDCHTTEMQ